MTRSISNLKDQQMLEAAFEQFNTVSGQLIDAYKQLEAQVFVLNAQLDEANNQLRKQRDENAALAERLTMLLEVLPAGVVELSQEGLVVAENAAVIGLLGRTVLFLKWEYVTKNLDPSVVDDTYVLRLDDGSVRRLAFQYQNLPASGGRIVLIHDVSRLHQLTVELARQQKLAAMGEMAASLAHQLRTPLATAMLYTANLRQDNIRNEDRLRFVDKSLARMKALEGLIQNMLGFVRGQVSVLETLDVATLVEEVCGVMAPQCGDKSLYFDCHIDLPSAIKVLGDKKALQGALINLLENAVHFSPVSGRIGFWVVLSGESRVVFAVEDEGAGIAPDNLDKLFEPFYTTRSGGTGLGLAIVKKVVNELGGDVSCSNREHGGARFELCLPVANYSE